MNTAALREQLVHEIDRIPPERLGEVFDVLHYFRLGLESSARQSSSAAQRRQPSARLAHQGARLEGDDIMPAIPIEDWGSLYQGGEVTKP